MNPLIAYRATPRYNIRKAVSSDIDTLFAFTLQEAREAEERVLDTAADALDLQLYIHSSNQRAVRAYQRRGFTVAPYIMMRREDRSDRRAQPASGADGRLHVFAGSGIVTLTNELKLIPARFTTRVVRVLEYARDEAAQQGAHTVGTLHLVSAFAREDTVCSCEYLASHVSLSTLGEEIETVPAASRTTRASDELTPDEELLRVFQFAAEEADNLSCARIGTAHLLLGILRAEGCAAETVLYRKGMRLEATRAPVAALTADRSERPGSKHD